MRYLITILSMGAMVGCGGGDRSPSAGAQSGSSTGLAQQRSAETGEHPSAKGNSQLKLGPEVFGIPVEMRRFIFEATLDDGKARGEYDFEEIDNNGPPFTASGPITCLVVRGHRAWLGGTIRQSNDPTTVGQDSWWQVLDNDGTGKPDRTTFLGIGAPGLAQDYCNRAPDPKHIFDLQRGRIEVRD